MVWWAAGLRQEGTTLLEAHSVLNRQQRTVAHRVDAGPPKGPRRARTPCPTTVCLCHTLHTYPNTCRFVGLLLVTKLLPVGDAVTVRRVLDTLGFRFIHRLLLPLAAARQVRERGGAGLVRRAPS